jgi:hypothetical protein
MEDDLANQLVTGLNNLANAAVKRMKPLRNSSK